MLFIRNAIKNRKVNSHKTDKYEADFYSRGIFRAKNIPKKFMGMEVGDFDGALDPPEAGSYTYRKPFLENRF